MSARTHVEIGVESIADGDGERDGAVEVQRRARVALLRRARDGATGPHASCSARVKPRHGDVLSQRGGGMAAKDGKIGDAGNAGGCGVHSARVRTDRRGRGAPAEVAKNLSLGTVQFVRLLNAVSILFIDRVCMGGRWELFY